jgi:hypothetical protein
MEYQYSIFIMSLNKEGLHIYRIYVQFMCEGGGWAFRIGSGVRGNLKGTWKFKAKKIGLP